MRSREYKFAFEVFVPLLFGVDGGIAYNAIS